MSIPNVEAVDEKVAHGYTIVIPEGIGLGAVTMLCSEILFKYCNNIGSIQGGQHDRVGWNGGKTTEDLCISFEEQRKIEEFIKDESNKMREVLDNPDAPDIQIWWN